MSREEFYKKIAKKPTGSLDSVFTPEQEIERRKALAKITAYSVFGDEEPNSYTLKLEQQVKDLKAEIRELKEQIHRTNVEKQENDKII